MQDRQRYILIAGEEGGPKCNKLGGIWNVINAEADNMANLLKNGAITGGEKPRVLVLGPYYSYRGSDWSNSDRVTELKSLKPLNLDENLKKAVEFVESYGTKIYTAAKAINGFEVGYIMFDTSMYERISYNSTILSNHIKREAYDLAGLNSLEYERTGYGHEYSHYLYLSFAIGEFARKLAETAAVSLHCHEFGVFYAPARLEKLNVPIQTAATLHATVPGRTLGYKTLERFNKNDGSWNEGTRYGLAQLEALAKFADVKTFVSDSTMKEARLFYGMNGMVIRNGMDVYKEKIDWEKKQRCRHKIQKFLSESLEKYYTGKKIPPEKIVPIFTISRIELENKGYPDLLDALVICDRIVYNYILSGDLPEDIAMVCFLIAAHGPKDKNKLPEGFPVYLPNEILIDQELYLKKMVEERTLLPQDLTSGRRRVGAIVYPQWIGREDGGLGMSPDEFMSGCIAGIFPSRYDPFLLTGLEAGAEGTPSIISRACGFSEAFREFERVVGVMGGVVAVDNITQPRIETVVDYAMSIEYFMKTFLGDKAKYQMLCNEAFQIAKGMHWESPVKRYYEVLTGVKVQN